MFNKSRKQNTEPTPENPESGYDAKVIMYEDGWSTLEINTPGDSLDFAESNHKYFKHPMYDSGSLMLRGKDAQGNTVRLFFMHGEFGVIEQTSGDGDISVEAMLLEADDMNLQGKITIGEPYQLPDGDRLVEMTGVVADYKSMISHNTNQASGPSPFRQADTYLSERFPDIYG